MSGGQANLASDSSMKSRFAKTDVLEISETANSRRKGGPLQSRRERAMIGHRCRMKHTDARIEPTCEQATVISDSRMA